jgi:hypothetical protein
MRVMKKLLTDPDAIRPFGRAADGVPSKKYAAGPRVKVNRNGGPAYGGPAHGGPAHGRPADPLSAGKAWPDQSPLNYLGRKRSAFDMGMIVKDSE